MQHHPLRSVAPGNTCIGGADADGRRAAHLQRAYGIAHLIGRTERDIFRMVGQARLVEYDHRVARIVRRI